MVYFSADDPSRGPIKRPGQIVDFTGRTIRLRSPGGVARSYPAHRVVRIETDWTPAHRAADVAKARGEWRQAIAGYREANRGEQRAWARRKILADLARCYAALDDLEEAGELFMLLVASDPTTAAFDAIPLAWRPDGSVPRAKARQWMDRSEQPVAVLLGASHLMSTERRPAAIQALQRLTANQDPRIAALAEAQIWRALLVQADHETVQTWQRHMEKMPASIRAGPCLVLGHALMRQQQWEQAALVLLRVPILHPSRSDLAARSLLAAADAMQRLGQPAASLRLLEEVTRRYAGTRWSAEADARLRRGGHATPDNGQGSPTGAD